MYYDKQKVIDWAYKQIGYREKASNSQLDEPTANAGSANWNKYAAHLDSFTNFYNGRKNGYAWCDVFVDDGFVTCYGREAAQYLLCQPNNSAGAGCSFSAQYFNAKGQFHKTNPQTGDQIFFGYAWNDVYHTGLVVEVTATHVITIEGNTSDMVAKRSYKIGDSCIFGYGRPNWGTPETAVPLPVETPEKPSEPAQDEAKIYSVSLPLLMIGDKGGYVRAAQTLLIARGYDCGNRPLIGTEKADGDFGSKTEKAVGFFQSKNNLEIDGEIGGATWAALLKFE